jgi:hypothetical protein
VAVPDWSGPVSRAVTELPGAADVWVVLVRFVAAYVDGCQDAPGLVALSRGLRRTLGWLGSTRRAAAATATS